MPIYEYRRIEKLFIFKLIVIKASLVTNLIHFYSHYVCIVAELFHSSSKSLMFSIHIKVHTGFIVAHKNSYM